jgi:hypothetical protein
MDDGLFTTSSDAETGRKALELPKTTRRMGIFARRYESPRREDKEVGSMNLFERVVLNR